jgi:hypothetical protein
VLLLVLVLVLEKTEAAASPDCSVSEDLISHQRGAL